MQNGEVFLKEHCGKLTFVVADGSEQLALLSAACSTFVLLTKTGNSEQNFHFDVILCVYFPPVYLWNSPATGAGVRFTGDPDYN